MSELLIIYSGKLKVYFYNKKKSRVKSVILNKKDMILLISGGHGFKVLEKVEMLETKQGPFLGDQDKIRLKNFEKFIPVNEPLITNSDVLSVSKVKKSGWILQRP